MKPNLLYNNKQFDIRKWYTAHFKCEGLNPKWIIAFICLQMIGEAKAQISGSAPATLNVGTTGATGINWYKDNVVIAGATSSSYSATTAGVYHAKYTNPGDNKKCTTMTITLATASTADLGVSITPLTLTNNVGETQQYLITVTNNGPNAAPNAIVQVPIPNGRTFLVATPSQGNYDAGTKRWTIGNIANGANATMTLSLRVN